MRVRSFQRCCVAAAAILSLTPAAAQPLQQTASAPKLCEIGAYRSPGGDILAVIKPPQTGYRYTFLDGRRGLVEDAGSIVACRGRTVTVQSGEKTDRWERVPFRITRTRFLSGGVLLAGMLLELPKRGPKPPLVVMAHGSENWGWLAGTQSSPYLVAAQGVSVFIFDKHGTGSSGGKFHMNFPRLATDIVAASAEARRLAKGRFSRFGLHGASQGGWTVPLAIPAAKPDFVTITFGGVFSPQEEDAEQVFQELRQLGYGADVLAMAREVTDATGQIATSDFKSGRDALAKVKAKFAGERWLQQIEGEYTGDLLRASPQQLAEMGNPQEIPYGHDAMAVLRSNLNVPTLWILAEQDREAPGDLTEQRLNTLIGEGKPIQVVVFPGTDHGMVEFVEGADGTRRYTRVTNGYHRLIADWPKRQLRPPYGRAKFWDRPKSD